MDTVIGRPGGAVLVTMVERKSRLLRVRLAASKEALAVSGGILEGLKSIKDQVHTLTYDNGKEFAKHELISDLLEADGYFAHPYHSYSLSRPTCCSKSARKRHSLSLAKATAHR